MTEEFCRCEHGKSFHGHKGYRCQYRIEIKRGHPKKQCGCVEFVLAALDYFCGHASLMEDLACAQCAYQRGRYAGHAEARLGVPL